MEAKPISLHRSNEDRLIAGVCGGLGEYTRLESALFRVIFIALSFVGGVGFLLYALAWIFIPADSKKQGEEAKPNNPTWQTEIQGLFQKIETGFKKYTATPKGQAELGQWLIMLGIVFLLLKFTFFTLYLVSKLWPLLLIFIGWLLIKNRK